MAARPGFMVYHRRAGMISCLTDTQAGQIFKAIIQYSSTGVITDFADHPQSQLMSIVFTELKTSVDEDAARYERTCHQKAAAANARWAVKQLPDADACTCIRPDADGMRAMPNSKMQSASCNLQKATAKGRNIFSPPSTNEVAAFCKENGFTFDPSAFVDFYEARGWMLGKTRMKDWRAACRTWERNQKQKAGKAMAMNYDMEGYYD